MADKSIGELIRAERVFPADLWLCEQSGIAKAVPGQIILNMLLEAADGHGGIKSWKIVDSPGSLNFKLVLTLAKSGAVIEVPMTNGRGIVGVEKTGSSGNEETGIVDTYTFTYNDQTTSEIKLRNGKKGDKGDNTYVWIKFAGKNPSEPPHSMGDIPDRWIGFYWGSQSTAPTNWNDYMWFEIKGDKGDTGEPAKLVSSETVYQSSSSGTVPPSGKWLSTPPVVTKGHFLWTRITQTFNSGDPVVSYTVGYMGMDGMGTVSSFAGYSPDPSGNIDPDEWNTNSNHPVGSLWFSDDPQSPAERFGGTWEKLPEGTTLVSAGENKYKVGSTGGEEAHAITGPELAKHEHKFRYKTGDKEEVTATALHVAGSAYPDMLSMNKGADWSSGGYLNIAPAGEGKPHNNMPPYYATYIWRRVA